MKQVLRVLLNGFICSLCCSAASTVLALQTPDKPANDNIDTYANRLTIDLGSKADGTYRLRLPLDVYRGVAYGDLRDVRVFNARGERTPYAMTREPDRATASATTTTTTLAFFPLTESEAPPAAGAGNVALSLRMHADGTLISLNAAPLPSGTAKAEARTTGYIVDASRLAAKSLPLNALQLDWVRRPESQSGRVRVEVSNDLNHWRTVVAGVPLVDLQYKGERLSESRVALPGVTEKYLRLTWEKAAFLLNSVEAETVTHLARRVRQTSIVNGRAGEKPGEYLFDFGARISITGLRLVLPDVNTIAPTTLLAYGARMERQRGGQMLKVPTWLPAADATFYRLMRDGVEIVSPAVAVAATTGTAEWLARVDARAGGIGSGMPSLEATWQPHDIVFVAHGEAPFTLAFGKRDALNAALTLPSVMPGYKLDDELQLPQATLRGVAAPATTPDSNNRNAPAIVAPAPAPPAGQTTKIVLWLALIVGVLLLSAMALRLGRGDGHNVDQASDDGKSCEDYKK